MMPKKRVVLFIVEGINDKIALALPLEKLLTTENVKFEITEGDITSDYYGKDAAARVGDLIKKHCDEYKYKREDFAEVVLLVDMDGAYISENSIIQSDDYDKPYYDSNKILHQNPEKVKKTHGRKQKNLNRLIFLPQVNRTIPFSVYFFSCNLDHVICENANLSRNEKSLVVESFEEEYQADPTGFISFFHADEIAIADTYNGSWNYIKQDINSLKRCSNFHIFLSPRAIRIPRSFSHRRSAT